jgi:hypothetical protein
MRLAHMHLAAQPPQDVMHGASATCYDEQASAEYFLTSPRNGRREKNSPPISGPVQANLGRLRKRWVLTTSKECRRSINSG